MDQEVMQSEEIEQPPSIYKAIPKGEGKRKEESFREIKSWRERVMITVPVRDDR